MDFQTQSTRRKVPYNEHELRERSMESLFREREESVYDGMWRSEGIGPAITKGLSKDEIKRLRAQTRLAGDWGYKGLCGICRSPIVSRSRVIELKCLHFFHAKCILEWLQESRDCPFCRRTVMPNRPQPLACQPENNLML